MPPVAAVDSLQDALDQTAHDESVDPAERVASLRALRADLATLVGIADRYIADQELQREGGALGRVRSFMDARAEANARGGLLDDGAASPEALDSAGVLSHEELDRRLADGTIEEAIVGLPHGPWDASRHGRGFHGRFESMGRTVEPSFKTRARELDTRVADAVARSGGAAGEASPGTAVRDTGPVPDLNAPANPAGKVSQKRLLAVAKGALSQPSTVDVYSHTDPGTGKRVYDQSRQALHQRIIDKALEGAKSQKKPRVMFMGGGYASGKGTLRRRLESEGKVPKDAVTLDPDQIKAQLPEFQHMAGEGDPEANLAVYEEAWDIAKALQHEGQKRKVNMVVDGLGNTSPEDMLNRVKSFRDAGYTHAEAHYAHVGTDEAVKRANHRAANSSRPENRRVIPESLMRATHRDVAASLPGIIEGSKGAGGLDALHIHDTSEREPKPLYSLKGGKETVHDQSGLDAALGKAQEKVAGVDAPARADTPVALEEIEKMGLNEWPEPGEVAKSILGSAKDTQELHAAAGAASPGTGGAVYSADRKPVHDQIVGDALAGPAGELLGEDHAITKKLKGGGTLDDGEKEALRSAATAARDGGKPQALFMGGGSASGKSSALAQAPELVPSAAVHIDPDAFKEQLPEYQQMVDGGDRFAAGGVHEESADLAKRAQAEARELGLNMLIDGTGDSKAAQRDEQGKVTAPGKFAQKLIDADKAGYDVNSLYVTVPTNTAVVRSVRRAAETGRFVPVPEVRNQHRNVSANFPEIADLPFVKDMKVFDTSGDAPALIAHGSGGSVNAVDPEAFQAFLEKANE